jgi:hypothetical protein
MLILREVAASTEDSSSALGANGGTRHERQQTPVVNPEAVQCRHREIRTDKSAWRTPSPFTGTDRGVLRSVLGPWSPVPKCEAPGAPISVEEHTSMIPRPRRQSQNPPLQKPSAIPE